MRAQKDLDAHKIAKLGGVVVPPEGETYTTGVSARKLHIHSGLLQMTFECLNGILGYVLLVVVGGTSP